MKVWLGYFLLLLCAETAYPVKKETVPPASVYRQIDRLTAHARYIMLKRPDSAQKIAEQALVLSKRINYKHGIGESFMAIGISYWVRSSLPISQFYLIQAVPFLKDDKNALGSCYRSIARNYADLKDTKRSMQYFQLSLKLVGNDVARKAEIYTELTALFNITGDYVDGLRYIDTAFRYSRIAQNPNLQGILYNRLGQLYMHQGKLDMAQLALDTCYQVSLKLRNKRLRSVLLIDQARLAALKNDLNKAVDRANAGYLLADSINSSELKLRAIKVLTGIYTQQSKLKQAAVLQDKAVKLHEDINAFNDTKTLQLIQDYAALNDKLDHIERANIHNSANEALIRSQHKTIALLAVLLVVALILLIAIFIYYKEKQEMNNRLQEQHQVLIDQKKVIELQRTDLEEVNKLKDKLLTIIGHDLRTPIASLSSIADLFSVDYITAEEVKNLIRDLTPVIKGAEMTLSNLMDFAGSQMKGQNINAAKVNVCQIANEMRETFEHQLRQKSIYFNNDCLSDDDVWADGNHIKVILRNLISNAIKFTNNNGRITVVTKVKDGQMEICVADTGVGMSTIEAEKVFNSNLHFSQTGTSGEKGTGLGLLLCKELVELNKGRLWVNAVAGEGCRFFFTLPLYVN